MVAVAAVEITAGVVAVAPMGILEAAGLPLFCGARRTGAKARAADQPYCMRWHGMKVRVRRTIARNRCEGILCATG